jgi:uncharacterized protein YbjT (DUF2867 family)
MKAIVLGATGLVGSCLVKKLLQNKDVSKILVFTRRPLELQDPKLEQEIVDFDDMNSWAPKVQGDVLFSAFGTTLRAAGSKDVQYKIDYHYQLDVAKMAAQNGVSNYVLVSTINADPKSVFFYLRMKGELEEAVKELPFKSITILRPGPLRGKRERMRIGEVLSITFLELASKVVKMRIEPVPSEKVAQAALNWGMKDTPGIRIIGPNVLEKVEV